MKDEMQRPESAEILVAKQYMAEALTVAMQELSDGKFSETETHLEKGSLDVEQVRKTIALIGDLEQYSSFEAVSDGRLNETVIFERTQENGLYTQIQYEGPMAANTDEIVVRSFMVSFKKGGKTTEVPSATLHVVNTEWRSGDERLNSIVELRTNKSPDGEAMIPGYPNFESNEIRLVNPELTSYEN